MNVDVEEILKYLGAPSILFAVILIYLVLHPEIVEKWSVLLWEFIYWITKMGEKRIVKYDIQGRINEFSKLLGREIVNYEPVGIAIDWVKGNEEAESFFKENKLIVRLRHHDDQDKNFVHAAMIFISKAVLTRKKKYLAPTQKESIDLYVGKKLCEKERPRIADKFFDEYFGHETLENNKIMELIQKYEIIDKVGIFYAVLIQELSFLGNKVFLKPRNADIITEVANFINFLEQYAEREIGEEGLDTNFEGRYCRCGIVIIAKRFKRMIGDAKPYVRYIQTLIGKKIENIYLIGSVEEKNKKLIEDISLEVQRQHGYLEHFSKEYKAKIKSVGKRVEVDNFLVLIRSPETVRIYDKEYQEKFITSK